LLFVELIQSSQPVLISRAIQISPLQGICEAHERATQLDRGFWAPSSNELTFTKYVIVRRL